jgi:hypothetical protein
MQCWQSASEDATESWITELRADCEELIVYACVSLCSAPSLPCIAISLAIYRVI